MIDEIVVCACGWPEWIIGTGAIQCADCKRRIPADMVRVGASVTAINAYMKSVRDGKPPRKEG